MSIKTLLVTGGCGFIGSNFIRHMLKSHEDLRVINFDALTYAGNLDNLAGLKTARYEFVRGDITVGADVAGVMKKADGVVHFAAESHVDRSIEGVEVFSRTNTLGTQILLEQARRRAVQRFVYVSTDEVYGSLGIDGKFTENSSLAPNSPYAASKAGGDLLVRAYFKTFGFPGIITRCSNNYGPYQFPEKLIPLMIANAMENMPLGVYGDGLNVRDWIYVDDHCRAIDAVLSRGDAGEIYNIGSNNEWTNLDIVKLILKELGKPESLIKFIDDRLGHDRRYAIDAGKITSQLHWKPEVSFQEGIKSTIQWYLEHQDWIARIKNPRS